MVIVGLSTKCFSQVSVPLERKVAICKEGHGNAFCKERHGDVFEIGNAFEIDFTVDDIRKDISPGLAERIREFKSVFLLAPKKVGHVESDPLINYGDNQVAKDAIARLADVAHLVGARGVIFYPYLVSDFGYLLGACKEYGISPIVENMDAARGKMSYHKIYRWAQDFEELAQNQDVGIALNLQHAYECDSSMRVIKGLVRMFKDRIRLVHVSGRTISHNHWPIHCSDDPERILDVLDRVPRDVPLITQGYLLHDFEITASEEIRYIKGERDRIPFIPEKQPVGASGRIQKDERRLTRG